MIFVETVFATADSEIYTGEPFQGNWSSGIAIGSGETIVPALQGLVIGIDPGHQKDPNYELEPVSPGSKDKKFKVAPGTTGIETGTPEYEVDLEIALKLKALLEYYGAEVVITRSENEVDISNIERAKLCNDAGCDLVLRLHCNGSTSREKHGAGMYVGVNSDVSDQAYIAAGYLLDAIVSGTGAYRCGIYRRDSYTGLNWSETPSVLIEMGFLTNPEEEVLLLSSDYQQQLVEAIAWGVSAYFADKE